MKVFAPLLLTVPMLVLAHATMALEPESSDLANPMVKIDAKIDAKIDTDTDTDIVEEDETLRLLNQMGWYEMGRGIGGEKLHDRAGYRVATNKDGTVVAVSAPDYFHGADAKSGRVRVYRFDAAGNAWRRIGSNSIEGNMNEQLGTSLAMDQEGTRIVVGLNKDTFPAANINVDGDGDANVMNDDAGAVRVFKLETDSPEVGKDMWYQVGDDIDGVTPFGNFGAAVDMNDDGTMIAIGEPNFDTDTNKEVGRVHIYVHSEGTWEPLGVQPIMLQSANFNHFGSSVSLSNPLSTDGSDFVVAIGAPHAMDGTGYFQTVYFNATLGDYVHTHNMAHQTYGENVGDNCGASVSISRNGKILAVGTPLYSPIPALKHSGMIKVYHWDDETSDWVRLGEDIFGEGPGDEAGSSVSLSGQCSKEFCALAVGAPKNRDKGKQAGHVRVYHIRSDGNWAKMGLDVDGDNAFDLFGTFVSMSDDGQQVAVGAPGGGYARLYHLTPTRSPTISPTFAPTPRLTTASPRGGNTDKGDKGDTNDDDDDTGKANGFIVFLEVLLLGIIIATIVLASVKASYIIRQKLNRSNHEEVSMGSPQSMEMTSSIVSNNNNNNSQEGHEMI